MDYSMFSPGSLWAMYPRVLDAVTRGKADKLLEPDDATVQAFVQRGNLERVDGTMRAAHRNGVGILPVFGPIWGRYQWMSLANDLTQLLEDPHIHAIVLDVDTPGGMVTGTQEFADLVYGARGEKPIVAFVAGMGASAGYWLTSAADEVVIAETGEAGSIGVQATYWDWSGFDEQMGIEEITVISSQSPDKNRPPTESRGLALLQARVDELASVFVAGVARNRDVSEQTVLSDFGQGDLIVGQRAVDAGLADRVGSFEDVLSELSTNPNGRIYMTAKNQPALQPGMYRVNAEGEATAVTIDAAFLENCDAHKAAVEAAVEDARAKAFDEGKAKGAEEERSRISAIQDLAMPGFEAEVKEAIDNGLTAEATAAAILKKQKDQGTSLAAQRADGTAVPHGGGSPANPGNSQDPHGWGNVAKKFGATA